MFDKELLKEYCEYILNSGGVSGKVVGFIYESEDITDYYFTIKFYSLGVIREHNIRLEKVKYNDYLVSKRKDKIKK